MGAATAPTDAPTTTPPPPPPTPTTTKGAKKEDASTKKIARASDGGAGATARRPTEKTVRGDGCDDDARDRMRTVCDARACARRRADGPSAPTGRARDVVRARQILRCFRIPCGYFDEL
jgi:hypothetical protein